MVCGARRFSISQWRRNSRWRLESVTSGAWPGLPLGKEVGDEDVGGWRGERRDMVVWPERQQRPVGPAVGRAGVGRGLAADLEHPVNEIHDPVLRQARPRVEVALAPPIKGQARVRD